LSARPFLPSPLRARSCALRPREHSNRIESYPDESWEAEEPDGRRPKVRMRLGVRASSASPRLGNADGRTRLSSADAQRRSSAHSLIHFYICRHHLRSNRKSERRLTGIRMRNFNASSRLGPRPERQNHKARSPLQSLDSIVSVLVRSRRRCDRHVRLSEAAMMS
jgi:hypothetical protein